MTKLRTTRIDAPGRMDHATSVLLVGNLPPNKSGTAVAGATAVLRCCGAAGEEPADSLRLRVADDRIFSRSWSREL
jgi:hypothetical protein